MYTNLQGVISVDVTNQLLIRYSAFLR